MNEEKKKQSEKALNEEMINAYNFIYICSNLQFVYYVNFFLLSAVSPM